MGTAKEISLPGGPPGENAGGSPLLKAMSGRCPRCGRGRLFKGFLAVADRFEKCGLGFSGHDAADGPAVFVRMTTLDVSLNRVLEPRTSGPAQRLEAIEQLSAAGVHAGTLVAPVIPGLTDHEIAPILEAAAGAGAKFAGYIALRLPYAVAPLFEQWLEEHYPARQETVLNRARSMRAGQL